MCENNFWIKKEQLSFGGFLVKCKNCGYEKIVDRSFFLKEVKKHACLNVYIPKTEKEKMTYEAFKKNNFSVTETAKKIGKSKTFVSYTLRKCLVNTKGEL
jgi:hypothetical protein